MSSRTQQPTRPDPVIVDRIRYRIAELLNPSTTVTDQWLLRPPWTRLRRYSHIAEHASLVDQLRDCAPVSTAGASGGGPSSKPAANLSPLDTLAMITTESARWVTYGLRSSSGSVVADLQLLSDRAPLLEDRDDLKDLDWHVTRWWSHARIITTWDTAPMKIYAPCDQCGTIGSLRIRLNPMSAVCFECGASWDQGTIGILGEHVRIMLDAPSALFADSSDDDPDVDPAAPDLPNVLHGTTYAA